MSCVVRGWDVLFVKGMHFSSKNACLLNYLAHLLKSKWYFSWDLSRPTRIIMTRAFGSKKQFIHNQFLNIYFNLEILVTLSYSSILITGIDIFKT